MTISMPPTAPEPTGTPATSWVDGAWAQVIAALHAVPTIAWVAAAIVIIVLTLLAVPFLRSQAFKAGTRHGKKTLTDEDLRDRRLLIAAMVPASLFWVAVLTGSARGLIAFGRDNLHWTGGWEFLVPFTLDGVAISFALLAFRAVKKELNPDRAVRIAGLAMVASAGINFLHEVGGSKLGAGYLAILSLLGMLIFDELLGQFELGAEVDVRRKNPKFGLRWATWPTNTVCAWVAWRNHPDEDLKATVANAVEHLERVRLKKATDRAQKIDNPVWWMRLAPWAQVGALRVLVSEQRSAVEAEQARSAALIASNRDAIEGRDKTTEQMAERFRADAERMRKEHAERLAEQERRLRQESAEQRAADRAEHAKEVARLEAELAKKVVPIGGTASKNKPAPKSAPVRPATDREALREMFAKHPEPDYVWTDREVNTITGAGFSSRAPRLTALATKHLAQCPEQSHKTCYTERSDDRSDDSKEQAS